MPETPTTQDIAASLAARDAALRDVERTMLQIVQTSISMIGFGFTIHAFLQNADSRAGIGVDLDQTARRIGLALLTLGLVNLAWGAWNQSRHLVLVQRRHPLPADAARPPSNASTFVIAYLLLAVGTAAFAAMIVQTFK